MKFKIKSLAISLVAALVLIEGYLIVSSILDNYNENNQTQNYCVQKCDYNPSSFLWEFTGDNFTKGFKTREECFNYCTKVKQGFVYYYNSATASLGSVFIKFMVK